VRATLAAVPGVQKVDVEFEKNSATVFFERGQAEGPLIAKSVAALEGAGYKSWDTATEKK